LLAPFSSNRVRIPTARLRSGSPIPETIGRYEVARLLGQGAMGRVFLARDPVLNRDVALKVLRDDLGIPPEVVEALLTRMRHEAQAAARVSHPNIVTLHDMGEDDQVGLYLVFECVNGPNLKERLKSGRLPAMQAARLARELGSALACAHLAGVLHRDVKPENVMLAPTGAKIADFGIAKIPDSTLTRAGTLVGTPAYCAPEALASGEFSPESDQFSLAATLYEAVSGERAFPGEDAVGVAAKIATAEPRPIARKCNLPDEVDEVLLRGLDKHPARRFASAAEFGEALATVLDRTSRTALASGPVIELARISRPIDITPRPDAVPPVAIIDTARHERQRSTMVLGAITVAIAGVMVGYAANGNTGPVVYPPATSAPSSSASVSAAPKATPTPLVATPPTRHRTPSPSTTGSGGPSPATSTNGGPPGADGSNDPPTPSPPASATGSTGGTDAAPPTPSVRDAGAPPASATGTPAKAPKPAKGLDFFRQPRRPDAPPGPRHERCQHEHEHEHPEPGQRRGRPRGGLPLLPRAQTALERHLETAAGRLARLVAVKGSLQKREPHLDFVIDRRDPRPALGREAHVKITGSRQLRRIGEAQRVERYGRLLASRGGGRGPRRGLAREAHRDLPQAACLPIGSRHLRRDPRRRRRYLFPVQIGRERNGRADVFA
jgi:eukaryotic-like serine/threonine-protein kinase